MTLARCGVNEVHVEKHQGDRHIHHCTHDIVIGCDSDQPKLVACAAVVAEHTCAYVPVCMCATKDTPTINPEPHEISEKISKIFRRFPGYHEDFPDFSKISKISRRFPNISRFLARFQDFFRYIRQHVQDIRKCQTLHEDLQDLLCTWRDRELKSIEYFQAAYANRDCKCIQLLYENEYL